MATEAVRTANALGSAIAVLSEDLGAIVWANGAGRALLRGTPDEGTEGTDAQPVMRQIGAAIGTLRAKGRAQLLLRPASAALGRAVLARLERIEDFETPLALLTVRIERAPAETRLQLAERLITEAGLGEAAACIVARDGLVAAAAGLSHEEEPLLAAQGQEFLASGETRLTVEDEFGALSFAEVAHGLVLIHVAAPPETDAVALPLALDEGSVATPDEAPETAPAEPFEVAAGFEGVASARPADDVSADTRDDERAEDEPVEAPVFANEPADSMAAASEAEAAMPADPVAREAAPQASDPAPAFRADLAAEPSRFVWQIDAEGRFSSFSPEFAAALGPRSADVVGRSFTDVATVYGFDEGGDIGRLLARRDTWSGRSILWPVEGTDRRAPIDLAALPLYGRDRQFEGFRGFGVVRPAEHVEDPDALGLVLARPTEAAAPPSPAEPLPPAAAPEGAEAAEAPRALPKIRRIVAEPASGFGRRSQRSIEAASEAASEAEQAEDRRRLREASLSSAEAAAFRAIGVELQLPASAPSLVALASQRPSVAPAPPPILADALPGAPDTGLEEEDDPALAAARELETLLDALPLAALVQMQEQLVFANRRFFGLTGYPDLDALDAVGGLDHLVVSCGIDETDSEAVIRRADGSQERVRLYLQRITVAGRSCLLMTFPAPEQTTAPASDTKTPDARALDASIDDLRRERDELQAVLDTATDGILLLDDDERLRKMNGSAEALFGLAAEQYLGRPFVDLLAPESRQPALDYIETLRDNGLAAILNDGREVSAKVAAGGATIPLFVTLGRLADGRGWCVVIRDIAQWKHAETDLVAARRQAEDASLHKSRFLANISHELRTPLNAIIGFADVMASECFGPIGHARYLEYLGDIKRSGHHVLDLVNDLLDISKIEAGKVELTFESVSLNEVVAEVVSLMQPQANRERVIVRSVLPASVPPVVADRRSVRQIALNLIANAVRFTPAGGQIVASTHYGKGGEVTLRFRDSGIGMTEREIEIALTPFQQVNAAALGQGEGTGLGLPLTKAMAEANRALFSIASTPGEGTSVEIVFPAQRVLAD